ncbi:MAG: hypothetical protein HKN47_18335 [Pirellulaceae bacterium]|nr:hypothetical protein [Pirellulaceae bacterium]
MFVRSTGRVQKMLTNFRFPSRWLACFAAGCLCLMTADSDAMAGHCGCEATCEVCPPINAGCTCDCGHGKKFNCLQKALDGFTAGIDKLLSLGSRGCDDALCDDACDAMMIEELMVPMAPSTIHHDHGHHAQEVHQHDAHTHGAHDHGHTHEHDAPTGDGQVEDMPPPVRLQDPPSNPDEGSLFETQSDPFQDDDARLRAYRPIRPSAYQRVELRPIEPPSNSLRQSSRRVRTSR